MVPGMRGRLELLTRWLRLLLACLAVGSTASPAQVASAVEVVCVAPGGPGKKPVEVVERAGAPVRRPATSTFDLPARAWRCTPFRPPAAPRPSSPPRFLLHRALLN